MGLKLNRDTRLLFIGDSITDCGRSSDAEKLGHGYVRIIRDWLLARDPEHCPQIINVGISGNKMPDLLKRWQRDVISQQPDIVSIKIGINDVWHGLKPDRQGCPIDQFIAGYRDILAQLRQSRPQCRLVLCEPSIIDPPQPAQANELLQPYVRAVHDMAAEFAADAVVKLHQAFVTARNARPQVAWTTDGVHPTATGHTLIARTWLAATGLL
ncbi:MAG TPA: SGNH/GDSL hydrolase family protein [Tepidisphaeraceae bacterium]|nr:SGNH/GDSL hydrolase family protein [Tepidisphaeraceae bacterium]